LVVLRFRGGGYNMPKVFTSSSKRCQVSNWFSPDSDEWGEAVWFGCVVVLDAKRLEGRGACFRTLVVFVFLLFLFSEIRTACDRRTLEGRCSGDWGCRISSKTSWTKSLCRRNIVSSLCHIDGGILSAVRRGLLGVSLRRYEGTGSRSLLCL